MKKLYKDIFELKTWIRNEEGATAEGKGQFGKIHSEKQLLDLIYKFNKEKKKSINIMWFNQGVTYQDGVVIAKAKVVITNGEETIVEEASGIGEEKRSDISFGLGKALTYGKRFWLQKFLDLSTDDIDPEHESNKPKRTKKATKAVKNDGNEMAYNKLGKPINSSDGVHLTNDEKIKALNSGEMPWNMTYKEIQGL